MMISNPSNSLEWMVFLAQKYSSMFIKGTWLYAVHIGSWYIAWLRVGIYRRHSK